MARWIAPAWINEKSVVNAMVAVFGSQNNNLDPHKMKTRFAKDVLDDLAELQRLTRGALADMRIMLRELRPHTITATKLETLLTQLCEGIAARHDIPLDVNIDPICELPPKVHIALYRIAQETMNNIAKHTLSSIAFFA